MSSIDHHSFPGPITTVLGTQQVLNKSMSDECYEAEKISKIQLI